MDNEKKPIDWTSELAEQLDWHWQNQVRPRLQGLTDDEYFWEPVPGCWSIRPREAVDPALAQGSGDWVIENAWPGPDPSPVTTIAWRLAHVIVGVFAIRNGDHFGAAKTSHETFEYAPTAVRALEQMDEAFGNWIKGVRSLDAAGLARPCGPAEGPYAEYPLAELILHLNREALHHWAEISLLRDLYRAKGGGSLAV